MEGILTQPVFQMSLLLFVALAGYLIASRINQSAVIGLILVGILVGPSVLGLVTYTDFISALANLGAVILLFVIGLEFKLSEIVAVRNGIIAGVGVIIPWIGGTGCPLSSGSTLRPPFSSEPLLPLRASPLLQTSSGRWGAPDKGGKSDHRSRSYR